MPTAVSVARQCLTADAAQALDEAVAVAQRRGHAQTTSLHVVFALLSLPSSALRDACTRARGGSTYSPRLQLKALELCLSVSLDRVPSGQLTEDPPVSNSLMAAIKRSQANQRRQPENFHLYHQLSNQSSSINNVIKVELQHLILSILDDPVVSRVFGEAGFRSPEIKIAIVRPLPQLLRYSSRPRGPPMFLCNLNQDLSPGCIKFPFSVFPGISDLDDNHRQIGEILGRSKGRNNPLLIGATASSILKGFIQTLSLRGGGEWLFGFRVIDMESCGHDKLEEEVGKMVKSTLQEGWENTNMVVVVNMGDLTSLSEDDGAEGVVVTRLTTLLGNQEVKMRLMGWVESYDTYLKYVNKYPSVEKDWELQLLPIPTLSAAASMPELLSYPRSRLMESFVPLGGFFTSSTDLNGHLPCSSLSHKSDAALLPKEATSIADRCQYSLPPWMQMADLGTDAAQAKDDTLAVTTQLEKESLHQNQPPPILEHDIQSRVGILPTSDSSKKSADKEADASRCRTSDNSCGMESPKIAISISSQVVSEAHHLPEQQPRKQSFFLSNNVNSISAGGALGSSICCRSNDECLQTSPASVTSATSNVGLFGPSNLNSKQSGQFCEKIYGALIEKVGRQYEAVRDVSKTVAYSRMKSQNRGDLWLSFLGPDRIGKRKVAVSLSEVLYGSRENLIDVDLCSSFELESSYRGKTVVDVIAAELSKKPMAVVFLDNIDKADEQIQSCLFQAIWTGKLSDSFGREVRVNRAIFVITSSFTTPNEEEITAGEAVKAVTAKYSEDTVLAAAARKLPLKILVEEDTIRMKPQMNKRKLVVSNEGRGGKEEEEVKKRAYKTTPTIRTLDLNLPAEIEQLPENQNDAIIMMPESSKAWLLDFFDRTDASIIFRPYDFDSLAEKILKDLRLRLHQTVKKDCSIEMDTQVMEQLLSAVYTSDSYKVVDDWITQVETHYITNTKLTTPATVRLTVCEDEVLSEEQSSCGNLLPCLS